MAEVSFYLFETSNERQVDSTCRLCRKLLGQQAKIWLYCPDVDLQQQLDQQLWCFDATSFLAHGIDRPQDPICISAQLPTTATWIIFNFSAQAIEPHVNFDHIIEIIENDSDAKQLGRDKFKHYRSLGLTPRTFKL